MGISFGELLLLVVAFLMVVLPCILAARSKRVNRSQRLTWIAISFVFGWIGFLIYYFVVVQNIPLPQEKPEFMPREDNPDRKYPY